ncbi:ABC transporter permease [Azospirillum rugosum]|uniref:NitT/TauT family transport system permease protein n=1 Tax=Azospirillum rugosum TaxID=416170 RepID=A0ABS4SN71_9PROT|nr:NitT/TauT family transport system permease protein [Azospirillum rugosum]
MQRSAQPGTASKNAVDPLAEPDPRRQKRRERILQIGTLVLLLAAWEFAAHDANKLLVAMPSDIALATWDLLVSGELLWATLDSMSTFVLGFVIASVLGIVIGFAMGTNRTVEVILDPYINALYAMPLVALIPILMLWVGIGFLAKITIIILFAVFPVIINTVTGVKNVDKHYLDIGKAFMASRAMVYRKIIAPYAMPYVASGLRIALGRGIIAMIVAEFLTSISGLGGLIINYTNAFETAKAFAPVLVVAVLANALTLLVQKVEARFGRWRRR